MTTLVVMAGVKLAGRASDKEHPYGHERLECVAAIILAVILGLTGLGIGWAGVEKVRAGAAALAVPGGLALAAAVVSIVVKEAMYWYTRAAAKKTGSGALMADAWHHRSDALSSVGSFIGIGGARMGLPILDPIASVVICALDVYKRQGRPGVQLPAGHPAGGRPIGRGDGRPAHPRGPGGGPAHRLGHGEQAAAAGRRRRAGAIKNCRKQVANFNYAALKLTFMRRSFRMETNTPLAEKMYSTN